VMEYLEGETLAQRLAKGPLPLDQVLRYAIEISDALDKAHRKGITHRDLKPGNIMLTKSGTKLLDFGLAKLKQEVAPANIQLSQLPTAGEPLTAQGTIVGTLQYMAPEQLEGKEVDARTDIFAFGTVVYEMATGKKAFEGKSQASLIAKILETDPPPMSSLQPMTPPALDRAVKTCLAKDPDDRFQSAHDLKLAIEWSVSGNGPAAPAPSRSRKWIPWAAAAVFAALAMVVWLRAGPAAVASPPLALTIVPPPGSSLQPVGNGLSAPEISPDGSSVMYQAAGGLWVRQLDSLEPKLVRGLPEIHQTAFWSPDSRTAAVPAGRLIKVRVPDGAPEMIAPRAEPSRGGTWSDNGTILMAANADHRLCAAPASGGELKPVDIPGMRAGRYRWPQFLPGSEDFLFLLRPEDAEGGEVYLATLRDGKAINAVLLMKNDTAASYTPAGGGRILFVRNDNLYSQKLDLRARKLVGDAELLQPGVASIPGSDFDRAAFSVSRTGVVAWRPGKAALNQVTIFDRQGKAIGTAGPPSAVQTLALSPDETRLLAAGESSWLLEPGQSGRLPLGPGWEWDIWSPDGSRLLGRRSSSPGIGERTVASAGEVHPLSAAAGNLTDVSPDGKQVLLTRPGVGIYFARLEGPEQDRAPQAVVENQDAGGLALGARFSSDGRWIVYRVTGTGIYVQPFPGPGLRTQIANFSGFPIWRKDGKEIVIYDGGGVWSVRVDAAGGGLRFGAAELLFSGLRDSVGHTGSAQPLAVSRDGSRFYFLQPVEQPESGVIHVRMGWETK